MAFNCKICKADHEDDNLGMILDGKRYCFVCVAKAVRLYEEALENINQETDKIYSPN